MCQSKTVNETTVSVNQINKRVVITESQKYIPKFLQIPYVVKSRHICLLSFRPWFQI